jgi:hypothetical protein
VPQPRRAPDEVVVRFAAPPPAPPTSATMLIEVAPGVRSLEGPRVSASSDVTTVRHELFVVRGVADDDGERVRRGAVSFYEDGAEIAFTQALAEDQPFERLVLVTPAPPHLEIGGGHDGLSIGGLPPESRFTVSISGRLRDVNGTALGRDQRVTFRTAAAQPTWQPSEWFENPHDALFAPTDHRALDLRFHGVNAVDVEVRRHDAWMSAVVADVAPDGAQREGERIWRDRLPVTSVWGAETLDLDLDDVLTAPLGHYTVELTPVGFRGGRRDARTLEVVCSDLTVTVAVGDELGVAWVTDLAHGAPVEGATVSWFEGDHHPILGKTGADGMLLFETPDRPGPDEDVPLPAVVVDHRGDRAVVYPDRGRSLRPAPARRRRSSDGSCTTGPSRAPGRRCTSGASSVRSICASVATSGPSGGSRTWPRGGASSPTGSSPRATSCSTSEADSPSTRCSRRAPPQAPRRSS